MADATVYRATTTAPVNIAVVKYGPLPYAYGLSFLLLLLLPSLVLY